MKKNKKSISDNLSKGIDKKYYSKFDLDALIEFITELSNSKKMIIGTGFSRVIDYCKGLERRGFSKESIYADIGIEINGKIVSLNEIKVIEKK